MCMDYVNIGTDILKREYMNAVIDTDKRIKPAGGLWCTEYKHPDSLSWLNYMLYKPSVFFHKAPQDNPFKQTGVLIHLKEGTKVFSLCGQEGYHFLKNQYGLSYEKLSELYDGVFIDIGHPFGDTSEERCDNYNLFSVNTFILFNLDAVEYYRKMAIDIDPFDYEYEYDSFSTYRVDYSEEKYTIEDMSPEYWMLLDMICSSMKDFILMEKQKYPQVSSNKIAYLVYEEVKRRFQKEISEVAKTRELNVKKLTQSLCTSATRRVK